ncbi:MAG: ABC transporter ATP-binding protein [Chloroflexi bacterium]|nr:ABC transporter ATP-binding protein [Chloroflexota bacterium]
MCGLSKSFATAAGRVDALVNISLTLLDGEFGCIVGPSGCGKTTLLRIIAGLDRPTAGRVEVSRSDAKRPLTAMVFQGNAVFPWLTVRANVAYGLSLRRVPKRERDDIADGLIAQVGLRKFADAYPHQLSEGMRQRVSIARALAVDPELLLMDEPFGSLDEQTRALLQEELLRIWAATGKTVLFITHSIDEALVLGDRIFVLSAHPGRLKAELSVPFARPRDVYGVKREPEFGQLAYDVWQLLREEVLRARDEELGLKS